MNHSLNSGLRNRLAATIKAARRACESGARNALAVLAVGAGRAHPSMTSAEQDLRRRLRAHGRQLGDRRDLETGVQTIDRLAHEVAYEHWHRMLFARFLAENELLIDPESGVAVSLADCEELAREQGQDRWTLAGRFAEGMLPRIFRSDAPALAIPLAPETRQALERLLESLPPAVFAARDSLGWTYQFWQAERKEAVNKSGVKIGAEELPAVTQLFTERYMVLFLLHNTVGSWREGRVLAAQPELAATAASEDELRRAVRLEAAGGYDFSYLRFVREPREDDEGEHRTGPWRPAAGICAGWPRSAADLRVLDPCCGSGHFLVECLDLLARLRVEEEGLAPGAAVEAVLRGNLFGLEIDPRCTQIAAFNLGLAAWTWPGAGGHRPLPALNLACSGLTPNATRDDWTAMAEAVADAGGLPAKHDLLGVDDSLMSAPLRHSLGALHDLFAQAPVLGSLIDPRAVQADLLQHDYESARALLGALLDREGANDEQTERAVAAQGMARAAELLAGRYHLVITNVPYLARGKQGDALKQFAQERWAPAKGDLATLFAARAFDWLDDYGTQAVVTPQNWLFLTSYRTLRETLLKQRTWNLVARLGEHAFEDSQAAGAFVALNVLSADQPARDWRMAGIDVSAQRGQRAIRAAEKAALLRGACDGPINIRMASQAAVAGNPGSVVHLDHGYHPSLLANYVDTWQGIVTCDDNRFLVNYWEITHADSVWTSVQQPPEGTKSCAGKRMLLRWQGGVGDLHLASTAHNFPPRAALERDGVAVQRMSEMNVALMTGEVFGDHVAPVIPKDKNLLASLWCFAQSGSLAQEVRRIDPQVKISVGSLLRTPFDPEYWQRIASEKYPNGLPEPYSDDPTQLVFHGHPCGSVVWDEERKHMTRGPRRLDETSLQVAVARLLGYRWPAEHDSAMRLAPEARTWVERSGALAPFADADGIVCLSPVSGEPAAADRLRRLLAAANGAAWSFATEKQLLAAAATGDRPAESLEAWLRDRFFEEHCRLFQQRPFVWHVWDGRRDGFHALVNYHRLAGPDGEARRTLETATWRHLGEWIARQRANRDQGVEGADGRLAAAQDLQNQLARILTGEPPCDLFVRWKPLAEQPIGWEPDINDGIRINIRPFVAAELTRGGRAGAGVLRVRPKIAWKKDRGKEALRPRERRKRSRREQEGADHVEERNQGGEFRPREDYPWFWGCPGDGSGAERTDFPGGPDFDGNRWNDLHYTNAVKWAARVRREVEARRREDDAR